jgi:hypothetical protein
MNGHRTQIDWRPAVVMLIATVCLALERGMSDGTIPPFPSGTIPYVSLRKLFYYVLLPACILPLLGHNPLRYVSVGRWRAVAGTFLIGIVVAVACGAGLLTLASARRQYAAMATPNSLIGIFFLMFCTEFFFRGFLVLPLFPTFGWNAALVAIIPYCLVHLGRPAPELLGSIPFGLALSYLSIRSGSVLYATVIHWVLAAGLSFWLWLWPC